MKLSLYVISLIRRYVHFVNHICLAVIVVILCVFVALCVYCCSYFRCRTAG